MRKLGVSEVKGSAIHSRRILFRVIFYSAVESESCGGLNGPRDGGMVERGDGVATCGVLGVADCCDYSSE